MATLHEDLDGAEGVVEGVGRYTLRVRLDNGRVIDIRPSRLEPASRKEPDRVV